MRPSAYNSRRMDSTSEEKTPTVTSQPPDVVPFGRSLFVRLFVILLAALLLQICLFIFSIDGPVPFFPIALAVAVSFLLSCVLAYMIAHPILVLAKAARRIAEGDSSVEIGLERSDEIGQLFRFFKGTAHSASESRERGIVLSQIKSQFVTVAAHQLRTPLSAMKWSLRLMLDGDMGEINEKQREFLQQSYQTNEHMIRLINDFLDISRIEEGRFGFHFKKTPILDTIKKAVQESFAQAAIRGVDVSMEFVVPEDLEVIADESRIYTAMTNILDNAIRYSDKGDKVTVEAALKEGVLEVRVTDAGIGMPTSEQQKVFSRFYRASNAIRQQTEGSGLGLFIAKNIIERHGGTIRFTSEEHKGTSVFFTLPAKEDFIKNQEASFQPPVEAA